MDKLKKYLVKENKSATWLAKKTDRALNTIYSYLSGKRNMPYSVAIKVEKITKKKVLVKDLMNV